MRLISYRKERKDHLAFVAGDRAYDVAASGALLPGNINAFLQSWETALANLQRDQPSMMKKTAGIPLDQLTLMAPIPYPTSCRDAYAFRQHVATARRNRGAKMISEFDQFPVFYFTNHHAVYGPGEIRCMPDHFQKLDFELEVAIVICKKGKNILAEDADKYIGGFMIMNDFSARQLQMEEMKLNLGPAKGKDFATAFGPWLVTPDDLEPYQTAPKDGHTGKAYDLKMACRVNGITLSEGNLKDMDWTFAEIIERCSYGAELVPGDIIGSGTVGTGCLLELNGTGKLTDPAYKEQWLQPGDTIEMEVEGLGALKNTMVAEETDYSILKRKKNI